MWDVLALKIPLHWQPLSLERAQVRWSWGERSINDEEDISTILLLSTSADPAKAFLHLHQQVSVSKAILHGSSYTFQGQLFGGVGKCRKGQTENGACRLWGGCGTGRQKARKSFWSLNTSISQHESLVVFAHKEKNLKFPKQLRDNTSSLPAIDSAFARADPLLFFLWWDSISLE